MKVNEIANLDIPVDEAESHTAESAYIKKTLIKAGYEFVGEGADATVWVKEGSNNVLKIVMPETGNITQAAYTFKKFVEFCLANQDIECLPRFAPVGNEYYKEFTIGEKTYIQVFMEKLYPIKRNSLEEAMVWYLSDFAQSSKPWKKVKEFLGTPAAWQIDDFGRMANQLALKVSNLKGVAEAKYHLLYHVMILLYQTGKVNKMYWDLHTENVMRRDDGTLVIIDPWFEQIFSA